MQESVFTRWCKKSVHILKWKLQNREQPADVRHPDCNGNMPLAERRQAAALCTLLSLLLILKKWRLLQSPPSLLLFSLFLPMLSPGNCCSVKKKKFAALALFGMPSKRSLAYWCTFHILNSRVISFILESLSRKSLRPLLIELNATPTPVSTWLKSTSELNATRPSKTRSRPLTLMAELSMVFLSPTTWTLR
jgi:hypothetical protein